MGVQSWLVRWRLRTQVRRWKVEIEAERARLAGEQGEGGMPMWLHTFLVIFAGGALAAAADALSNGFTPDKAGFTRLATSALAGGLVALVAWLKQSPRDAATIKALEGGRGIATHRDPWPPPPAAKLLLLGLLPLLTIGCASAQMRLGREPRPLAPDPEVVEQLVCTGQADEAARYVELRGGSQADRIELVERARKAVSKRPGCCAAEGKCGQ